MPQTLLLIGDRKDGNGEVFLGLWQQDGDRVYEADFPIPNPKITFQIPAGSNAQDVVHQQHFIPVHANSRNDAQSRLVPRSLGVGQCYERMHRIRFDDGNRTSGKLHIYVDEDQNPQPPIDNSAYSRSLSQLLALREKLTAIFRVVEPEGANLSAYGHEIRNLLLVASTEFESHCKAILTCNGCQPIARDYSTKDYVKLADPLRLKSYEIRLPLYQDIPGLRPFSTWNDQSPTQTLPWYHAYNETKHDRETKFSSASLEHLINAIAACTILTVAQFGVRRSWTSTLGDFFSFTDAPRWPYEDMYHSWDQQSRQRIQFSPIRYSF